MLLPNVLAVVLVLLRLGGDMQPARGQIGGTTTDETGFPIRGAFVTLRPARQGADTVELEVLSDESGAFRFDDVPAGSYRLASHLWSFYPALATVDVAAGRSAKVSLVMSVAPVAECMTAFQPKVEFKTGEGDQLPAAYVTVARKGGRPQSYEVRPNGHPDVCFSPTAPDEVTLDVFGYGEHVLKRAGDDPYSVKWQRAIAQTAAARNGRTKPGPALGQIRGRVFDVYGASIPDPSIVFEPVDPSSGLTAFKAQADARGRFDFEGVRTGTYRVTCRALGYETSVAVHEVKPGVETEVTMVMRAAK